MRNCIIILLLYCHSLTATTKDYIDSVKSVLNKTNISEEKLLCLYTLSFEYGFIEPRKGIDYGQQCLSLAKEKNNLLYQLNAYNGIANAFETLARYDSAKYFHQLSHEVALEMKDNPKIALTEFNIGLCDKQLGNYKEALKSYLNAYKVLENELSYNPRIHFYIGELQMKMGKYDEAYFHSKLGIKKCKEFKHDYIIYNLYINLAKCYLHDNKTDSAIHILNSTLSGLQNHVDENSIAICYHTLGEAYIKKNMYQQAIFNFSKELTIQEKLNNPNGEYMTLLYLAYCHAIINSSKTTVENYITNAENNFKKIKKNNDVLLEIYQKTGEIYELIHQYDKALKYYKLFNSLHDSILNQETINQILELETKYKSEKKDQQIVLLKQNDLIKTLKINSQKSEINKRNIIILFSVFLLLLIGILVSVFQNRRKLKSVFEKELAIKNTEEKERIRIAKDIHDDLGAGLSKINFLSELMISQSSLNPKLKENLTSISETSKDLIVNMRDLIWALDKNNMTLTALISRMHEYSYDYLDDVGIELSFKSNDFPDYPINRTVYRELLLTLKESLNNIIKHSKTKIVFINIQINSEFLLLNIKDKGVGFSESEVFSGNGISNMKKRIESFGGKFDIKSEKNNGTTLSINIPIQNIF